MVMRQDDVPPSHHIRGSSRATGVDGAEMVVQRHGRANAKFTRLLASLVMTSDDVCDLIPKCLSCVVYVLTTLRCVIVVLLFRSSATRGSEGNAQDDKIGGLLS